MDTSTGSLGYRHRYKPSSTAANNQYVNSTSLAEALMTEEELEKIISNFANEDTNYDKTWTRIVIEKVFSKFSWYFPSKDLHNGPSLSKAYAYYEHITLPRHVNGEATADHILRKAEPGESQIETELYSPFLTPASSFIEWGIGIDLYFSTLWIMSIVLFICGCIHLPNLIFYRNEDYSGSTEMKDLFAWSLRGSAICTDTEFVACVDCTAEQFEQSPDRFLMTTNGTALVLKNMCPGAQISQGVVSLVVLFFLVVVLFFLSIYLGAREVRFDEDTITATDYSIIVKNPPPDAYDPDEWRDFFTQFAEKQVTVVTIALNNEVMIRKLMDRRIFRKKLRLMLPKGVDMDDEDAVRQAVAEFEQEHNSEPRGCIRKIFDCTILPILQLFKILLPASKLVDLVFKLTEEIKELQAEKFDVTKVFVTFETEEGQRAALEALAIGRLDVVMNNKNALAPSAIFKDKILKIAEPSEPSAVRWMNLSASTFKKVLIRSINVAITILLIAITGYIVAQARFRLGPWAAAPLITISNTLIPLIVKILMIFEPHGTEGSFQAALYLKITLFRWVNTAFLIKILTPWTSTLQDGASNVLPQINAILWSELWISPTLRLLDLIGNVKKHILAPRARTQELMNLSFQGTRYNLGERYTDLTKVLFVCFYYSALYPAVFFFGTAILIIQYYTDKFCLMRIWASSAALGSEVAKFSRKYFFTIAVVAYAVISAYTFAGFPYDNLCRSDNTMSGAASTYLVNATNDTSTSLYPYTVQQDEFYVYCDQSWSAFDGFLFPPTARSQQPGKTWMSPSQETTANIYGWTAFAFVIGFIVLFFGSAIALYVRSWFRGVYSKTGQKQNIDFSSNPGIHGFVPQVRQGGFPFPFLICDIDSIDQHLIGWNDPAHSYDFHNLMFDIPWKGMTRKKMIQGNTRDTSFVVDQSRYIEGTVALGPDGKAVPQLTLIKPIFSIIKHYPPPWKTELKEEKYEEF